MRCTCIYVDIQFMCSHWQSAHEILLHFRCTEIKSVRYNQNHDQRMMFVDVLSIRCVCVYLRDYEIYQNWM